jgi:hypothetical protein
LEHNPGDGSLTLTSTEMALLELLPRPPWPSFRLEAEIQIRKVDPFGVAGVYFAYQHLPDGPLPRHVLWHLRVPGHRGGVLELYRLTWTNFRRSDSAGPFKHLGPVPLDCVRRVAVELHGEKIRIFSEGQPLPETTSISKLATAMQNIQDLPPLRPETVAGGGIGLAVYKASVVFRRVLIRPAG